MPRPSPLSGLSLAFLDARFYTQKLLDAEPETRKPPRLKKGEGKQKGKTGKGKPVKRKAKDDRAPSGRKANPAPRTPAPRTLPTPPTSRKSGAPRARSAR